MHSGGSNKWNRDIIMGLQNIGFDYPTFPDVCVCVCVFVFVQEIVCNQKI